MEENLEHQNGGNEDQNPSLDNQGNQQMDDNKPLTGNGESVPSTEDSGNQQKDDNKPPTENGESVPGTEDSGNQQMDDNKPPTGNGESVPSTEDSGNQLKDDNKPPTGNGELVPSTEDSGNHQKDNYKPQIEITVRRHKQLFELLKEPNKMWRVLVSLFLIIIILFIGLAFVVISIKKFYPYNMIETNIQGASIVKSEDKDVIYWLFNTADLWANSGIEVQNGDILTIRASGSSFTAIHHLVDASRDNRQPQDKWVGTEGQNKDNPRDVLRMQYRLCKDVPEGILLMKIISPDSTHKKLRYWSDDMLTNNIEVIGEECTVYISKPGVLHFAVNDIVLTDSILNLMYRDYIDSISSIPTTISKHIKISKDSLLKEFSSIKYKSDTSYKDKTINRIIYNINREFLDDATVKEKAKKTGLCMNEYPVIKNDSSYYYAYPYINELVYYKQHKFIDAWYMDNLGSFLIVIERKRK